MSPSCARHSEPTFAVIEPCAKANDAIRPALDDPELVAFLRGKGIDDVRHAGGVTVLHFGEVPMIVGVGNVRSVDAAEGRVTTSTRFDRHCVDGGRHGGRRLLSHDRRTAFRIAGFNGEHFRLQDARKELLRVFDPEDESKRRFWIADVGVGDRWSIPPVVTVDRSSSGQMQIRSNIPVRLSVSGQEAIVRPGETKRIP